MAFYIDPATHRVFISDPGSVTENLVLIDRSVARSLNLQHGQLLTEKAIRVIVGPDAMKFFSSTPGSEVSETEASEEPTSSTEIASHNLAALPRSVGRASNAAGTVEGFAWLILVLTVIAGIGIAAQTHYDLNGQTTHPYVGYGIGIAIGGSINCLMIIMVAAYIKAKMELARIGR